MYTMRKNTIPVTDAVLSFLLRRHYYPQSVLPRQPNRPFLGARLLALSGTLPQVTHKRGLADANSHPGKWEAFTTSQHTL